MAIRISTASSNCDNVFDVNCLLYRLSDWEQCCENEAAEDDIKEQANYFVVCVSDFLQLVYRFPVYIRYL